jgi:hypothetical protein
MLLVCIVGLHCWFALLVAHYWFGHPTPMPCLRGLATSQISI